MTRHTPIKTRQLYKRLLSYVFPFSVVLGLGLLANIVYSCIDAGLTYMMKPFLDKGFVHIDLAFIKKVPLILLIAITARGLVNALGSYCMTWVARSVVRVLRQEVFAQLVLMPADFYDEATSGQMLSKLLYDVEQVAQVSADALTDFVQNTCLIIGLLAVMLALCWQLSLLFLLTVPFVGLVVSITNRRVRRISHKVQQTMGEVTEIASEAIEGYKVLRMFSGIPYEQDKFNKAIERSRQNDMKVAVTKALNVFGVQCIIAIGIAMIIMVAIQLSTVIVVTAGAFLSIIAAMLQLIKPIKTLTTLNATIQRGLAGAESVFNLLDSPIERQEGIVLTKPASGNIHFQSVSYAYRQGAEVLHDITFSIKAGEVVALVGHSGSGKSTIASLLPRFYEVSQGVISLDGQPINQLSITSLRSQMALVSQQVTLFNDTIANNIAYGLQDVSMESIIEAARKAYAHDFIMALPEGYQTTVGENGLMLSGGQRQRIAIARAILKDAPILILDEATSALDSESEQYIQIALEEVMRNRSTLVIAHRLSTIQRADKILVMHQGRLIEQGKHQTLIELDGHYAQLFKVQQLGLQPVLEPA